MEPNRAIYIGVQTLNEGISTHQYAESCQLYQIFTEMTRIIARKNNMNIHHALVEYIGQCNKGEHVVLKSYNSFNKSILNRQCFIFNFSKIFQMQQHQRNGLDYYQLFRLLCSDFPKEIITNSVRLIEGNYENNMVKILNSKIFLNSLYINFIYSEYLENMLQKLFSQDLEVEVGLISVFCWIKEEDVKNAKVYEKPPLSILFQVLLDFAGKRNLIKSLGLSFLNEDTIDHFMMESIHNEDENAKISYSALTHRILHSPLHQKLVDSNLNMFDNSTSWATQASKLLNTKDSEIHPLNSKKMKSKK